MAPLYLANPRLGGGNQGRQSSGRTGYLRSAPSSVYLTVLQNTCTAIEMVCLTLLHGVVASYLKAVSKKSVPWAVNITDVDTTNASVPYADRVPITSPEISVIFDSEPTDEQVQFLVQNNFEGHDVSSKGKIYTGEGTATVLTTLSGWNNINDTTEPLGGTIKASQLPWFNHLIRHVTTVAVALTAMFGQPDADTFFYHREGVTEEVKVPSYDFGHSVESERKIRVPKKDEDFVDLVVARGPFTHHAIFGQASQLPTHLSNGMFLPFEQNFAGLDRQGIVSFLNTFYQLVTPSADDNGDHHQGLTDCWLNGLALTASGDIMAHMMASLTLAFRARCAIFFLVSGGVYEGAIMYGGDEFTILQKSIRVKSLNATELIRDIHEYASHSKSLQALIDHFGLVGATIENVTTMRQLRSLIWGIRNGGITAVDQAKITEFGKTLNFPERPVPLTPESLRIFVDAIHPTHPKNLPNDVFLPWSCLNTPADDGIALALAMFGNRAPSPVSPTGERHYTLVNAAAGRTKVSSPSLIKFSFKPIQAAANDWRGFMSTSAMHFEIRGKLRGQRTFKGTDKDQVWGMMTDLAAAGLAARKNQGIAVSSVRSGKRKDEGESGGQAGPSKKIKAPPVDSFGF